MKEISTLGDRAAYEQNGCLTEKCVDNRKAVLSKPKTFAIVAEALEMVSKPEYLRECVRCSISIFGKRFTL